MKIKRIICGQLETNTYLIIDKEDVVIIDPCFDSSQAAKINDEYNVKMIFLTHGHFDHFDAIRYFNCPIYISKDDKMNLFDNDYSCYRYLGLSNPNINKSFEVIELNDKDSFEIFDKEFICYKTPGHTKGSMVFHYDNVLFSGDTLFDRGIGRCDLPGGNENEIYKSLKFIFSKFSNQTLIYPGHNGFSTIKKEKDFHRF